MHNVILFTMHLNKFVLPYVVQVSVELNVHIYICFVPLGACFKIHNHHRLGGVPHWSYSFCVLVCMSEILITQLVT